MRTSISRLVVVLLIIGASCSDALDTTTPEVRTGNAMIRAINASASQFSVIVDADSAIKSVQVGSISAPVAVAPGTHMVRLVSGTTVSAPITVVAELYKTVVAVGRGAASTGITSSVLSDTGAIVPAGKSKLRVVHLAATAGAIEIWRTQPDYMTPIHIMTPFAYGAESPFLQSDPGTWEVFVTAAGQTTKLVTTGPIDIPAGQRRTAVLLDSAGIKFFRVLEQ